MATWTLIRRWGALIIGLLLGATFIVYGARKLMAADFEVQSIANFGYAPWFMYLIGAIQVAGGLLLLLPRFAPFGAVLLIPVMLGAVASHIAVGHAPGQMVRAVEFLALLGLLLWNGAPHLTIWRSRGAAHA